MDIRKIDNTTRAVQAYGTLRPEAEEEKAKAPEETKETPKAENRDTVSFTGGEAEKTMLDNWKQALEQMNSAQNKFQMKPSPPSDTSSKLTRRLVAATNQLEVQKVLGEASRELANLRSAAAASSGKERAQYEAAKNDIEAAAGAKAPADAATEARITAEAEAMAAAEMATAGGGADGAVAGEAAPAGVQAGPEGGAAGADAGGGDVAVADAGAAE